MSNFNTFALAIQGGEMRKCQRQYFQEIVKARKTGRPEDYAAAKETLDTSKRLEKAFDGTIREIFWEDKSQTEYLLLPETEKQQYQPVEQYFLNNAWHEVKPQEFAFFSPEDHERRIIYRVKDVLV